MKRRGGAKGAAKARGEPEAPAAAVGGETPFQRFESFARQVLSVPREELERRELEYQRQRAKEKKRRAR